MRDALKLEICPIGRLTPSKRNSRTHPLKQIDALAKASSGSALITRSWSTLLA